MNGRSSASHLNNSPKFYRSSTLLLLLSKIRELGQSEDNREEAAVFRVNTLSGRIRRRVLSSNNKSGGVADSSKIDKHAERRGD